MYLTVRRQPAFILFGEGIDRYNTRGVRWFIYTYFGAFWLAGLIAPLVYLAIQGVNTPADPDSMIAYLQSKPVAKYVDRFRLLFATIALLWMIGACRLWGRMGFQWGVRGTSRLLQFMLLGMVSLGIVVALQSVLLDPYLKGSVAAADLVDIVMASLLGGLIIGILEEAIFRGMVLRMFYSATQPLAATILSAMVFAAVHFKSVPDGVGEPFQWYSGLVVAGYQSISVFLTVEAVDFLNLFLAGIVLNLVFLRTGSLMGCVGLHAGWVLVRNTWSKLVMVDDSPYTQILGSQRIVDGYASLTILAILVIILYAELLHHQREGKVGLGNLP